MGCKIIVVACNTATTNAISVLRTRYDIPIIGIEPAVKPAALQTHSQKYWNPGYKRNIEQHFIQPNISGIYQ